MDHEDVFEQSMGTFKRYQCWLSFLIFLIRIPVGWHVINIIIIAPRPIVTCSNSADECDAYCANRTIDPYPFTQTIQSQWHLACDSKYLADFAQMFLMLGVMAGCLFFGMLGDKIGRRVPISIALLIQAISATAISYVPWLWLFILLRFLIGFSTGGTMTLSFVLLMELIGKRKRLIVSTLYQLPCGLAQLSLAGIGYWLRDWRHSQLFIGAPSFLLVSYFWLLPESPRYLISAGKTEKAIKTMENIAKKNRLPYEQIETDVNNYVNTLQNSNQNTKRGYIRDLFRPRKILWRTLILSMNWISVGLVFYGVSQYSSQISGDIFINLLMSSALLVPGVLTAFFFLLKLGRKYTLIIVCFESGVPLLIIPFLNEESIAIPTMALLSLFGLEGYFAALYVFSGELYPTFIRSVGVGFLAMTCRVGSVIAPFVATLGQSHYAMWVPPVIFGIMPLVSGSFVFFLPDTKYDQLADTLEEALNLGKKKKQEDT